MSMFKAVFSQASLEIWPTIALVIFFSIMVAITLWVIRPHSKDVYDRISNDIIDDEDKLGGQL